MDFYSIIDYCKYYWNAKSIYNIQAPLASEISSIALKDDRWYYVFDENRVKYPKISHSIGRKIFRLLQYFKPKKIIEFPENNPLNVYISKEKFITTNFDQLIYTDECVDKQLIMKVMKGDIAIIVHRSKSTRGLIDELVKESNIMLTLNFYDIFIAIQHRNLMKKQHFDVIDFWKKPLKIGLFN